MINNPEIKNILEDKKNSRQLRVAVLGDLMLDEYLQGEVKRISPEEPVPVVDFQKKTERAGGAANTALNIASLGAKTSLFGVVGQDRAGGKLLEILKKGGVSAAGVFQSKKPTIRKIRVMGGEKKQLLRIDWESKEEIGKELSVKIFNVFKNNLDRMDAVVFSDYNKGTLSRELIQKAVALAGKKKKIIVANFKPAHKSFYKKAGVVTMNLKEAAAMVSGSQSLERTGRNLRDFFGANVLITRGSAGLSLFAQNKKPYHLAAYSAKQVYDVVGAGDTVTAVLSWALASGVPLKESVFLANVAGSVAVSKKGTSVVSKDEIIHNLFPEKQKVKEEKELKRILDELKSMGKKIVFTNGCFDLFNVKHIEFLNQASRLGDILVVALNSDDSISKIKGKSRPIIKIEDRLKMVAVLPEVDYLTVFDEILPSRLIKSLRPDVFVKGGDYKIGDLPEVKAVRQYGGVVKLVPKIDGPSTTSLIEDIARKYLK